MCVGKLNFQSSRVEHGAKATHTLHQLYEIEFQSTMSYILFWYENNAWINRAL